VVDTAAQWISLSGNLSFSGSLASSLKTHEDSIIGRSDKSESWRILAENATRGVGLVAMLLLPRVHRATLRCVRQVAFLRIVVFDRPTGVCKAARLLSDDERSTRIGQKIRGILRHHAMFVGQTCARTLLEERGVLSLRQKHKHGAKWIFWAQEPEATWK
jgi:hypothetical protein